MSVADRTDGVPRFVWLLGMSLWMVPVFFGPGWAALPFLFVGLVSRRRAAVVVGVASGVLAITVGLEVWGGFTGVVNAIAQLTCILIALSMNPGWLRTMWERRLALPADAESALVSAATTPRRPARTEPRRGGKRRSGRSGAATPTEADRLAARVGAGTTDLLESAPDAAEPVDVQTATADELRGLPGITGARARKAVRERTKRGGFASVEDFGEVVGLQPHELVRLRAAATCSPRPRAERRFGRRVDY